MDLYSRHVFPRLCDWSMRTPLIERSHIDVDRRVQTAETLPFEDGRFDCVVSTWTLCSIQETGRAVSEIGRALRPGGRYIFLEHGLGDEPGVQRWQSRLTPLQAGTNDGVVATTFDRDDP